MALTDKDIVITPNRGQSADPKIDFIGASSTLGPQTISLNVYPTSNGTLSFEGSAGQLFSVTNSLTGTIYSVNDVSGIPSIEVLDTGLVKLAQYSGNVLIGTATDTGHKVRVAGTTRIDGGGSQPLTISTSSGSPWAFGLIRTDTGADSKIFLNNPGSGSAWVFEHIPYFYNGGNYNVPLHNGNYNSYSPTLTGGGASGTWGISITGNAATITNQANSATITASTGINGNEIVRRSAEGYIYANHVNFNTSVENPSIANFITDNGDGWSRKSSLDHVKNSIRGVADGTWGISITGNADTVDGVHASSFLRSAGHPGYGDWNTFGNTLQTVHEIYQENFNVGSNTGSSNFPTSRSYSYGTLINFAAATARAQVYISHAGNDLIFRGGWGDSGWTTWNKVLTDQNYNSYSPTLTGTGASGTWGINITGNAATATSATDTTKLPLSGGTLTGVTNYTGDNYSRYGPNSSWSAYLRVGGNGRVSTTDATVATTNGNLHLDSADGQNIYLNYYAGGTIYGPGGVVVLHSNNYTSYVGNGAMTVTAGSGLTGGGQLGTANQTGASSVTISHADTSSVANLSSDNSSGTVLQDIALTFDTYGHVTGASAGTVNLDDRYYTETEINNFRWFHSDRDFPNGTLIQTNINYAVSSGDPWVLEIRGNSYGNLIPFDIQYQGYIYSDTIINHGGYSNGTTITGLVVFNYNGNLCFWFPNQSYWHGYNVYCYVPYATYASNRVTSITNVAKPGGITKEVALSVNIRQSLHSGNYNSYSPTLTGGGASGTWAISITGNADTVDNLHIHTDRNNEANKLVRTDGSGYIQAGWINTTSGDNGTTAIDRVYASSDGYIRYYTPINFRTVLNVPTRTGDDASGTWAISITGNSASVGGLVPAQLFNNMGNNHGTYTDFNNVPNFGAYYVQQGGNSPTGTASHQWYGFTLGLGNEYALSSYGTQLYWPRRAQNSDTYIYVRDRENGSWTSWNKIKAGYADSAGSATSASTAGSVPASGITGQTGMWTSATRPGPYRLYRRDDDSNYSVQTYWTGSYWRLYGYNGDTGHADTHVGYSDSSGYAASAGTADQIDGVAFRNTGSNSSTNADNLDSNGITYYTSGVTNFSGNSTDGALYSQAYNVSWQHQIAGDYRSGQIALRGKNSGTWQSWRTVLDSGNYNSYSPTLTGTGASGTWGINITGNAATATSATDATKLPLTGGTMTGIITTVSQGTAINFSGQSDSFGYNGNSGLGTYIKGTGATYVYGGGSFFDGSAQRVILHANNYSSYALPLSGGTITGTLTTSGAITSGTSTLTGGGQLTLNGSYGVVTIIPAASSNPTYFRGSGGGFYFQSSAAGNTTWLSIDNSGNGTFLGNVTAVDFISTSDARLKTNIEPIRNAVETIKQIQGHTYTLKQDPTRTRSGVLAQELAKVLPGAVTGDEDTQYSVSYNDIIAFLVEAVKEQQQQIDELKRLLA